TVLPRLYDDVTAAINAVPGTLAATGHCSHASLDGGCLYFTFAGAPSADPPDGGLSDGDPSGGGGRPSARDRYYRASFDAAMAATLALGGAVSHHHGIGLLRGPWLRPALGEDAFAVLASLKAALDPAGILNPGKLGLPSPFVPDGWSWS
ncbi:MAG TPA: FAD-linked oxidase C-terminal domain-containing protein, partial [Acidimicrobiia bacterium]|nr:FAD-linked oxidase C-terminal domain-containing protein [Acidimicrobiia bacterium]